MVLLLESEDAKNIQAKSVPWLMFLLMRSLVFIPSFRGKCTCSCRNIITSMCLVSFMQKFSIRLTWRRSDLFEMLKLLKDFTSSASDARLKNDDRELPFMKWIVRVVDLRCFSVYSERILWDMPTSDGICITSKAKLGSIFKRDLNDWYDNSNVVPSVPRRLDTMVALPSCPTITTLQRFRSCTTLYLNLGHPTNMLKGSDYEAIEWLKTGKISHSHVFQIMVLEYYIKIFYQTAWNESGAA